jgi:hypothetical protein
MYYWISVHRALRSDWIDVLCIKQAKQGNRQYDE